MGTFSLSTALIWCCLALQLASSFALSTDLSFVQKSLEETFRFKRRGLKSSNSLPEFSAPIGNVSAVLGRDVRLVCTVENLGQYQVAWLKEETKTILSIDTNIIITNYRIFLIPDDEGRKWVLHIKDVQESDRGFYQCQVNTSPMRSTSGYLEVVVPPTIVESQTSQEAQVIEHSNVSIQCKANGHPRAGISWRREDGAPIRLNGRFTDLTGDRKSQDQATTDSLPLSLASSALPSVQSAEPEIDSSVVPSNGGFLLRQQTIVSQLNDVRSDKLSLYDVDRSMAGIYICTASNGIPSQVSKRIPLYVNFAPKTFVQNKYISVSVGEQLEIDCLIEAYPKANSYWSKKSTRSRAYKGESARSWPMDGGRGAISLRIRQQELLNSSAAHALLEGRQIDSSSSFNSATDAVGQQQRINNKQGEPLYSAHSTRAAHHHNRILQLRNADRQIDGAEREKEELSANYPPQEQAAAGSSPTMAATSASSPKAAYVSVKQTAVNSYKYKLRLTIVKVQYEDFGEYNCIATNPMGSSESIVFVTRADKLVGDRSRSQQHFGTDQRSIEDHHQSDGSQQMDQSTKPYTQQQAGFRRNGNKIVYDENYLQAIKTRTSNNIAASKLQQRLKIGQISDRNSANTSQRPGSLLMFISILLSVVLRLICTSTQLLAR